MSSVRGRGRSVEIAVDRPLPDACDELRAHLNERPDFYRGSHAVANLGTLEPGAPELAAFRDMLAEFGITLDGVSGVDSLAGELAALQLAYLGAAPVAEVSALPAQPSGARSEALGRSPLARGRFRRRPGRPRAAPPRRPRRRRRAARPASPRPASSFRPRPAAAPSGVSTLYHRGTLRGGQALHNMGNIVLIGDLNPGAELIASGDIVVVGALRGTAHAGAQGDRSARVIAIDFAPTQLRIATVIGADAIGISGPQQAVIEGDRIAVAPLGTPIMSKEASL